MYLAGNSIPDFRTINNFRNRKLKNRIQKLFSELVVLLISQGYVSLDVQYIDRCKIESAPVRYTFVWRGSLEKEQSKVRGKN